MVCSYKEMLLFFMMFCHVVDDFYLQGILAQMKQESWWKENYPENNRKLFLWSFPVYSLLQVHKIYVCQNCQKDNRNDRPYKATYYLLDYEEGDDDCNYANDIV